MNSLTIDYHSFSKLPIKKRCAVIVTAISKHEKKKIQLTLEMVEALANWGNNRILSP